MANGPHQELYSHSIISLTLEKTFSKYFNRNLLSLVKNYKLTVKIIILKLVILVLEILRNNGELFVSPEVHPCNFIRF